MAINVPRFEIVLLGRTTECGRIDGLLERVRGGESGVLVLTVLYALALLSTVVIAGAWSDRAGSRRAFVAGSGAVMAVASVLLAVVPHLCRQRLQVWWRHFALFHRYSRGTKPRKGQPCSGVSGSSSASQASSASYPWMRWCSSTTAAPMRSRRGRDRSG